MISVVEFEIKSNVRNWSNQEIFFTTKKMERISIKIKDVNCELTIEGSCEDENLEYIIMIWELLV